MKYFFLLFLSISLSFSQDLTDKKLDLVIVSNIPYKYAKDDLTRFKVSFEVQQWAVEILKLALKEIKENPINKDSFIINFKIYNEERNRIIKIPIKVEDKFVLAFKTEKGFNEKYYDFMNNTYQWIFRSI
jgi:hypothetical protein